MIRYILLLFALLCPLAMAKQRTVTRLIQPQCNLYLDIKELDLRLSAFVGRGEPGSSDEAQHIVVEVGDADIHGKLRISPYSITWGNGEKLYKGNLSLTCAELRIAWVEDAEGAGFSVWQGEKLIGKGLPPLESTYRSAQPYVILINRTSDDEFVRLQGEELNVFANSSLRPLPYLSVTLFSLCALSLLAALIILIFVKKRRILALIPLGIALLAVGGIIIDEATRGEWFLKDDSEPDSSFIEGSASFPSDDGRLRIFRFYLKNAAISEAFYNIRLESDGYHISLSSKPEGRAQTPVRILRTADGRPYFEIYIPMRSELDDLPIHRRKLIISSTK